jgi:hypothetical protein
MKLEINLSPYCTGILIEKDDQEDDQYIVVAKRNLKEDATLKIEATSTEGLKKLREHLEKHLGSDKDMTPIDKRELGLILGVIEHEVAKRG